MLELMVLVILSVTAFQVMTAIITLAGVEIAVLFSVETVAVLAMAETVVVRSLDYVWFSMVSRQATNS